MAKSITRKPPPKQSSSRPVQVTVTRGPAAAAEMAAMQRQAKAQQAAKRKG